jgi:hypothetical protein
LVVVVSGKPTSRHRGRVEYYWIYRRLLGVEAKTASVAVWHELGVASVATRIDAAALKFRNNI